MQLNQQQVRDLYLKIIDETVENVRTQLDDQPDSRALESLDILKSRWQARLTQTHDFKEDPRIIDHSSVKRKGKKIGGMARNKTLGSTSVRPSRSSRNGGISVAALTNDIDAAAKLPSIPRFPDAFAKKENIIEDDEVQEVPVQQRPTKRARLSRRSQVSSSHNTNTVIILDDDDDKSHIENLGENLDSSDDSSLQSSDSDEEPENFILAQHEKVRKSQKWKVHLRDGIISIRGKEYLFHRATCDFDF